jgi:hypothetical protein
MTTFISFLEELAQSHRTVVLPAAELERLVLRFGPAVRSMGFWDKAGGGSVEIPMNNITEAALDLDDQTLAEAVSQLKSPDQFAGVLEHGSAKRLIDALAALYLRRFQDRVRRFQDASDAGAGQLWSGISRELFGA